jgi:hypothetical protein
MARAANLNMPGFFSHRGLFHVHFDPVLSAFILVKLAHRIIFVLEFDLLDAFLFSLHGRVGMQRDEFTRLLAGIVVLVPGAGRR